MPAETITITSPSRMTTPTTNHHHLHKGTVIPAKGHNNSLLFSKGLSEDHKSPNSRLLQLAERTSNPARSHNNKSSGGTSSSSSGQSHLLSFRNVISPSKSSTSFARRNTSILNSSSCPTSQPPGEKCAVRQNPKLYTSFSSKSCSKLTKAFIRSDPLKTNIEHLVSPTHNNKAAPKSPSHSPNSGQGVNNTSSSSSSPNRGGGANLSSSDHNSDGSLNSGLSNLITPLKALHASFHDRSKLSNAFAPRSRLFSQKDKTKSSPKSNPVSRRENNSPDFLEYFGNPCNQLAVNTNSQQPPEVGLPTRNNNNYSTPDILENVLGVEDSDTNYIILDRGRRASEDFINRSNTTNGHAGLVTTKGGRSHSSSSSTTTDESIANKSNKSKSPLIISGTPTRHDNHVQISNRNLLRDQNHPQQNQIPCTTPTVSNLHTDINYNNNRHVVASPPRNKNKPSPSDTEGGGIMMMNKSAMKMSTATPMKISSSAACRAQIVTLMARSSDEADTTLKEQQQQSTTTKKNTATAAGAHLNSKESPHNHQNLHLQSCSNEWADYPSTSTSSGINNSNSKLTESGSKSWINSNHATSTSRNGHGVYDDNDECAPVPPPIPKRCSTTTTTSPHLLVLSPRCKSTPVPPPNSVMTTFNEMKSVSATTTTNPVVLHGRNNDFPSARPPPPPPPKRSFTNGGVGSNLIVRSEKRLNSLIHSFSFSFGRSTKCGGNGGCGGIYSALENETIPTPHLTRNRSRSLPKSFLSGNRNRNKGQDLTGRSALPSLWIHDEPSFERLSEEKISPQSSPLSEDSDITDNKMRWQKTTASSNSSSSSTMSGEGQQRRPKSFDYSQRKAWMKYYRDMEISSVNTTSNNNPGVAPSSSSSHSTKPHSKITKGSISHLHLLPPTSSIDQLGPEDGNNSSSSTCKIHGHPNPSEMGVARRTPDTLGLTPSLFQRFSKTFSLRFGSNSNMNKVGGGGGSGQPGGVKVKASKSSLAVGSSPDLHNRFDNGDMQSGKMRKEKSKSIRGEKCQSGDSGIGIDDSHHPTSRLRRIRSEFIETSCHLHPDAGLAFGSGAPSRNSSAAVLYAGECASAIGKMSLVEIPYWEEEKERQQQQRKNVGRGGALAASYEDVLETKLDGDEDDGFSSGEDSGSRTGKLSDNGPDHINNDRHDNPAAYHHYHSLPHKSSRKGKKENSHHPINLTPSGRSKSLEDEQDQQDDKVIIEDNSIRGKVIREIVLTEQNYVKTLNDIVQGFLNPCRARTDLFSGESVRNIFSNVEDILRLHARFLEAMKERIHPTAISSSHIGQIFTEWADHFNLYSEYCCNNPISMATVRSLMQNQEYAEFFEACRRLQLMDKLPLHGFLLRPIQRICQYHLQLAELLKQTEPTHEDYSSVVGAVETMKSVAMRINDTQRQFDSLQEIIRLQNSIEGWEGSDLLNRNSTILTKGELGKSTPGKRNNKDVYCFLLNKDLVFCKKDYIKKGGYVFDGRIDLEVGVWLNIDSNEEDEYFGMVHNSWRIYSHDQKTWVLFTAPTPTDKRKWITSLESAVQVKPADPRMCTMAKLTTMLSEDRPHHHQSQNYSSNCNTLPKSSKKSKGKMSNGTNGKIDADAMLIEVSKLKRSTYTNGVQQQHPQLQPVLQKDNSRASKFYV